MSCKTYVATLAFVLAAVAYGQSPAQPAYENANRLFEQRRLSESLAALEQALTEDPNHVPALTLKAKIAISMNRLDVAGPCLEKAVAVAPSFWYTHFLFGFWHYLRDDWAGALSELTAARRLNPQDARSALYLGMTYERLGDTQKTMTSYQDAIRIEEATGVPDPYTLLGYSRFLQLHGRVDECARVLNKALALYPNSRDVQYEVGRLLLKKGDLGGAARAGEAALRLAAEEVTELQIHYLLVRAYTVSGQDSLAAAHAEAIRRAEAQQTK